MAVKHSVAEALALIRANASPGAPIRVPINVDALGAVAAEAISATSDNPRFDCAAMDGYAARAADIAPGSDGLPKRLRLAADIPAAGPAAFLAPGWAAPISTGAPVPAGADTIVPREQCRLHPGQVEFMQCPPAGKNIRSRGEEIEKGEQAISSGTTLSAEVIGALLSYGTVNALLRHAPTIRILPTGSEIGSHKDGSSARLDSNGPMIAAACRRLGIPSSLAPPVPDDAAAIRSAIADRNAGEEILLTIGGVSAGDHDLIRRVVTQDGAQIIFHGIAMRPGKPLLFARLADGRLLFGLPGNPVATLVGFRFFALAAVRCVMGLPPEVGEPVLGNVPARSGTTLFLRARRSRQAGKGPEMLEDQRSHVLRSIVTADCWVVSGPEETVGAASLFDLDGRLD